MRLTTGGEPRGVTVDGQPLRRAASRAQFESGTLPAEDGAVLAALDPAGARCQVRVITGA